MASGLETRVPFLDNDLFDFGWNLKLNDKLEIKDKKSIKEKLFLGN